MIGFSRKRPRMCAALLRIFCAEAVQDVSPRNVRLRRKRCEKVLVALNTEIIGGCARRLCGTAIERISQYFALHLLGHERLV